MSFWSNLLKIAPAALAPFTGGASLAFQPAASAAGGIFDSIGKGAGAASQAAANNRGTEAELLKDAKDDLERQLIAREVEKRAAQGDSYRKAMSASQMLQWRPAQRPLGVPNISFTQGPGILGAQASGELYKQAMNRMKAPDLKAQSGLPAYQSLMDDPRFAKTLKPGIWERLGGIASFLSPIIGQIAGAKTNGNTPTLPGDTGFIPGKR
jgi:hypothetical protein